jgi:hypothetical protein
MKPARLANLEAQIAATDRKLIGSIDRFHLGHPTCDDLRVIFGDVRGLRKKIIPTLVVSGAGRRAGLEPGTPLLQGTPVIQEFLGYDLQETPSAAASDAVWELKSKMLDTELPIYIRNDAAVAYLVLGTGNPEDLRHRLWAEKVPQAARKKVCDINTWPACDLLRDWRPFAVILEHIYPPVESPTDPSINSDGDDFLWWPKPSYEIIANIIDAGMVTPTGTYWPPDPLTERP